MCIIVFKPKGQPLPEKKIFENCFKINSDGAGLMFADSDKVYIRKGYLQINDFLQALKYYDDTFDLKEKNVIFHFRIGTSGGISKEKCHPFPISNKDVELDALKLETDYGVVHNGVLSDYVYGKLSDTQNYIKDFIYPLFELNKDISNANISKLINATLESCKLIILDKKGDVLKLGEWKEENGIYYSNLTYKTNYYTSSTKEYNYSSYHQLKGTTAYGGYDYYNYYEEKEDDYVNYWNELYYDIISNPDYKMVNDDDVIIKDCKNPNFELLKLEGYDFFISRTGLCYEVDWLEETADYLGYVNLFDKEGNELKWSDL